MEALTQAEGLATRIATPTSPHRASKGTATPEVAALAMDEAGTTIMRTVEAVATRPTKGDSRAPTVPRGPILVSTTLEIHVQNYRSSCSSFGEVASTGMWWLLNYAV